MAKKTNGTGAGKGKKAQEDRSILINFVLDKSGSMGSISEATISGFNEFLGDQRSEGGDARMTLTLFDTRFHTVAHAVPVGEMVDLDRRSYLPGGMTALFDAIGLTMRMTDDYVAVHKPDQVLFVIMTDGYENSSREFTGDQIMRLIDARKEAAGYEFIYLGANQDSLRAAESIGIREGKAMNWAADKRGAAVAMRRASSNVKAYRRDGNQRLQEGSFFSPEFENLGALEYDEYKQRKNASGDQPPAAR